MNQILYVGKIKSAGFRKTAKISAIVLFIFAAILIGKAVYGFVSVSNEKKITEPVLAIREVKGRMELNITHDKAIDKIVYSWNNKDEMTLQGKGKMQITEKIDIPGGTNVLNIKITDIDKHTATYTKTYYKDETIDNTEPEIQLALDGSKVKVVAKDDRKLVSLTYYWNNEDKTVIQATEESPKQIEERIPIIKGKNTLTLIAVDASGNEETVQQEFKGAKKPTIELEQQDANVIIKIKDEENIKKVELTVNGEFFSTDDKNTGEALNMQEAEITQPLVEGDNNIKVVVYNVSDLTETAEKTFNYTKPQEVPQTSANVITNTIPEI